MHKELIRDYGISSTAFACNCCDYVGFHVFTYGLMDGVMLSLQARHVN